MLELLTNLTPEQVGIALGVVLPFVQALLVKLPGLRSLSDELTKVANYVLAFVLPLLGVIAAALYASPEFNQLVPAYALAFTTAQAVYTFWLRFVLKAYASYQASRNSVPAIGF